MLIKESSHSPRNRLDSHSSLLSLELLFRFLLGSLQEPVIAAQKIKLVISVPSYQAHGNTVHEFWKNSCRKIFAEFSFHSPVVSSVIDTIIIISCLTHFFISSIAFGSCIQANTTNYSTTIAM